MGMKLEPLDRAALGEYAAKVQAQHVYGILRRVDLPADVLDEMRRQHAAIRPEQIVALRLRKSRRWILPTGFPQVGWWWEAAFDFGPFKSEFNGPHDLDGGRLCDLCHTWIRYGHLLLHPQWDQYVIVGQTCSILLSDIDPNWVEKKLAREFQIRLKKQRERERLEAERIAARQRQLAWEAAEARRKAETEERVREEARRAAEVKKEREEREAHDVAAAMLRDFELRQRGVTCRVVTLSPGPVVAVNTQRNRKRALRQQVIRDVLPGTVEEGLHPSRLGKASHTFNAEITGIPFSGTIFYRNGDWRFVTNRPDTGAGEFSNQSFDSFATCRTAMIDRLMQALCQYVAAGHADIKYPWESAA